MIGYSTNEKNHGDERKFALQSPCVDVRVTLTPCPRTR